MNRPVPISDLVADDLLLDRAGRRQPGGDDPVAGLLAALADHADRPLGTSIRGRRSQRHRVLSALAALTIGASGAGVAAAVGTPDSPPDLPPRVAPSRVHEPAASLPGAMFGLGGSSPQSGSNPVVVLAPDGTRVHSIWLPAVWGPVVLSETSLGRSSASEVSQFLRSDLEPPPPALVIDLQPTEHEAVGGPSSEPESEVLAAGARGKPDNDSRPQSGVSRPATRPADPGKGNHGDDPGQGNDREDDGREDVGQSRGQAEQVQVRGKAADHGKEVQPPAANDQDAAQDQGARNPSPGPGAGNPASSADPPSDEDGQSGHPEGQEGGAAAPAPVPTPGPVPAPASPSDGSDVDGHPAGPVVRPVPEPPVPADTGAAAPTAPAVTDSDQDVQAAAGGSDGPAEQQAAVAADDQDVTADGEG